MKKVLIICDAFPPAFGPRMGYLCKHLKDSGWKPYVVSEAVPGNMFTFLTDHCPTVFVNFYKRTGKWSSKFEWIGTFMADFFFGYKDRCLTNAAEKLMEQESFDLILCSTYRTFPLPTARRLSRKYHIPFVADCRDIIEQYPGYEFMDHKLPAICGIDKIIASIFRHKLLAQRNKALQAASYLTTVSTWHVEVLKQYNPQTELIYNGFDPELFYPEQIPSSHFTITYTGRLLSTTMRNPGLLFEALSRLTSDGVLSPETCRVVWHIDQASETVIRKEAEKAGIIDLMDFKGYISATDIPKILNSSSVLLLLTNKSAGAGPKGIMTTKFFEFLAVEKPILCVRSDEDCLEVAIRATQSGLAARNVEEVCHFLEQYYNQWKELGYTTSSVRKKEVYKYSRKFQADQFIRIFDQIIVNTK